MSSNPSSPCPSLGVELLADVVGAGADGAAEPHADGGAEGGGRASGDAAAEAGAAVAGAAAEGEGQGASASASAQSGVALMEVLQGKLAEITDESIQAKRWKIYGKIFRLAAAK